MKPLLKLKSMVCILAALVCTFVSGCLQIDQTINLKPDGSGTIVLTMIMSNEAIQQMSALSGLNPDAKAKSPVDEMMNEAKAKEQAAQLGEGVKFVKIEKVKNASGEGSKVTFSFTDVTKVQFNINMGDVVPGGKAAKQKAPVAFQFVKGSPSTLTMTMDQTPPKDQGGVKELEDPNAAQGLEMAKQMMKGMRITMGLNVDGTLVATTATHKVGNKIIIADVPMDELMKDMAKLKASQKAASFGEAMAFFKDIPGMKIETKPTVTVQLK